MLIRRAKFRFRSGRTQGPTDLGELGMTLFELMIVVTMIGILSGIALSRLDWTRYRADAAGRTVMAELASAQRVGLSLQANIVITFPDSTKMMVLEDINNSGTPTAGERVRYVTLNDGFAFGRVNAPDVPNPDAATMLTGLVFHRDGSSDVSGTVYLHGPGYDQACRRCRAISVTRATGRIVWYSYASGTWRRAN
jgi:prepilin-type N-terminal cleavage/methylation domain-containing protein